MRDARRLRIGRDVASRSILGAILPLHDVRYRACASRLSGLMAQTKDMLCVRAKARLVEPDGIEPTTSCLQSRRSPNLAIAPPEIGVQKPAFGKNMRA